MFQSIDPYRELQMSQNNHVDVEISDDMHACNMDYIVKLLAVNGGEKAFRVPSARRNKSVKATELLCSGMCRVAGFHL